MKRRKQSRKTRPANEITEQEIEEFLKAIRNFDGYPRLRDLGRLLPSMKGYKINVILRFLERSKMIIVDNDGYITWIRDDRPDELTLGDVASIDEGLREFLSRNKEN